METFLREIQLMLNAQTKVINKRFDRLETKYTTLRNRVNKLENKEKAKQLSKPVYELKDFTLGNFDKEWKIQFPKTLHRRNPRDFSQYVKSCFEKKEDQNIYVKGARLYVYQDKQWMLEEPKQFLKQCREKLWSVFQDRCKEQYSECTLKNECPYSNAELKKLILKHSTFAVENRKHF